MRAIHKTGAFLLAGIFVSAGCALKGEGGAETTQTSESGAITKDLIGKGLHTGPDVKIEMKDGNEVANRVINVQVQFEGGACTDWHTHPGHVVVMVLEGAVFFETHDSCETYTAGEVFVDLPDEPNRVCNASGTDGARTHATLFLKDGEAPDGSADAPAESACGL